MVCTQRACLRSVKLAFRNDWCVNPRLVVLFLNPPVVPNISWILLGPPSWKNLFFFFSNLLKLLIFFQTWANHKREPELFLRLVVDRHHFGDQVALPFMCHPSVWRYKNTPYTLLMQCMSPGSCVKKKWHLNLLKIYISVWHIFPGFCKEATGQKPSNRSSSDEAAAAAFAERWGVCCLLDPAGGSVLCNTHTHTHMKKREREQVSGLMKLVYRRVFLLRREVYHVAHKERD